jgi:hypothetical protein
MFRGNSIQVELKKPWRCRDPLRSSNRIEFDTATVEELGAAGLGFR